MSPRAFSRHMFCNGIKDENDTLFLTDPKIFSYRELPDNFSHPVQQGDTLPGLASRYFRGFPRPAGLFWVIAWFQPDPIHDPTIALTPGTRLVIPSKVTIRQLLFSPDRYNEDE